MRIHIKRVILVLLVAVLFTSCKSETYSCAEFSVRRFKDYSCYTDKDLYGEKNFRQDEVIQFVKPEWLQNSTERPVYIRIEYIGKIDSDNKDDVQWDESEILSFSTGDIQWKGFLAYINYGTLTLIGTNQVTEEKWRVIGNQLDSSGEEQFSVEDVQAWLKTVKR